MYLSHKVVFTSALVTWYLDIYQRCYCCCCFCYDGVYILTMLG